MTVEGDLDLLSAPRLKETLTSVLGDGSGQLVLEFSGVTFMDSTALSVLIGVHRRLDTGEQIAIADVRPEVLRVLELSGLAATFLIFPTLDAALAHVASGAPTGGAPTPPLTADAALMVGIASTAMPFAQSEEDEVERWLRLLRRHGEAGVVLASLGISEGAVHALQRERGRVSAAGGDPVAAVTEHAARIATERRGAKVATTDVLLAVMHVYGATFERVLAAHDVDLEELTTRVVAAHPAAA